MNSCINLNSAEFRALQERSGLSDFLLEVLVAKYQDKHDGEWPHLDEIPADPEATKESLKEYLGLDNSFVAPQSKILEKLGVNSLEEALPILQDIFRNLDLDYYTINDKVKITTDDKPSPFKLVNTDPVDLSGLSSTIYINQALEALEKKMGIVVHSTTNGELSKIGLLDIIPEASTAAAFVYQGEIYVNQDIADVDGKVHELMHILLGGLRFKNPQMYMQLTSVAENLENYEDLIQEFPTRTRSDINEEIFVREYARMLSGLSSDFEKLDPNIIYNLNYEMSRVLDTMLAGDNSVRVIPAQERFTKTFRELGEIVNAHNMENVFQDYIDGALMHRILANKKEDLMKNGTLREECE